MYGQNKKNGKNIYVKRINNVYTPFKDFENVPTLRHTLHTYRTRVRAV